MTLSELEEYVRRRHNAVGDTNWAASEIYALVTARSNEILNIIGAVEATDTLTSTVIGTQAYSWPTATSAIKALLYNGQLLQQISFREWETQKSGSTTPSGEPEKYVVWNRQVLLIPIPSAVKTLTFYIEKYQVNLTMSTDTILVPEELHYRLADGVIGDMYSKDLNAQFATMYETKWNQVHVPAFYQWRARSRRRQNFSKITDSDYGVSTDLGVT